MANFKYIMQGFSENVNFCDEISDILKNNIYSNIYILTAFANDVAVYNLEKVIKNTKADITFIIGIRNGVTTFQALERLLKLGVKIYTFDTARSDSIFHVKTVMAYCDVEARVICGSANITTGGLCNNVEAGIITKLSFSSDEDKIMYDEIMMYINRILSDYPDNVQLLHNKEDVERLKMQGLLVDEKSVKRRVNDTDKRAIEKQVVVSKFPLVKRKLSFPSKDSRQIDAIYRKVQNRIIEDICIEVWKSKPLKATHLGIVKNVRTHAKGEMSLGKGQYKDIDRFSYFRKNVFGQLNWKKNKKGDEEAEAEFTLIICGINYGMYNLEVLHKRPGMVAYKQDNYVTSIRWGECSKIIRNKKLIGKTLTLLKSEEKGNFVIDIE